VQVWNVQGSGAKGAIVVNYEDKMTTMEAPDEDDEVNMKYLTCVGCQRESGVAEKRAWGGRERVWVSRERVQEF